MSRPRPVDVWNYSNVVTASTINVDLLFGADYFNDAALGLKLASATNISNSSTISTSNNDAFNMYFDGGQGDENTSQFVQNTATESGYRRTNQRSTT